VNICVLGLWHLGSVTAAGLAKLGHRVVGLDFDDPRAANLSKGIAPVLEPGLEELIALGLASGNLRFSSSVDDVQDVDVLWVAYDTPIDDEDNADTAFVMAQIARALRAMSADVVVLISSQLPVGSVRRLEQDVAMNFESRQLRVACCPENLRLGTAVNDFLHPQRIVAGVRSKQDKELLQRLLTSITDSIEWMSVESAEMTKHAINGFLATSVAFANEIASICESVGADAKEVERGLKTEIRIGPRAYVSPGAAFAGGTLARDIAYLVQTAGERRVATPLLSSVLPSNEAHRHWAERRLRALFVDLSKTTVAVWGLPYKPGTDTLRRSTSVELCDWLIGEGATIHVHDPATKSLPAHWCNAVKRFDDPLAAVDGADVLVVSTEWPVYGSISAAQLSQCSNRLVILDANRFLSHLAVTTGHLRYVAVGMPSEGL
jgi:UDPglucose 6-dehydrogenase